MYQNLYYQREKNLMHLWDDKIGYRQFPYTRYAYKKVDNGEHESIYGDKLTKIYKYSKEDTGLFESDVAETTRVLVDLYTESDIPSVGHRIMTYDIEVEMESGLPEPLVATNEITAIGLHDSVSTQYWILILDKERKLDKRVVKNVTVIPFDNEYDLLSRYLDLYEEINPTIVTGWNIDYFDTPYVYNRIKNVLGDSHAKRLSPIGECFYSPYRNRYFIAGVSYLDYLSLYKNYTYKELDNYRLDTIGLLELNKGKVDYTGNLDDLFRDNVEKFIEYLLVDVEIVVGLEEKLQFTDLARAICHAGHVTYEDFVYSSKYLEGALLTYLKKKNLVAPNKPADREERMQELRDNNEEKFIGAYVKDPIVGKYEWIYDLDLTSLYPSIIMTLNISPETIMGKVSNWDAESFLKGTTDWYSLDGEQISKENLRKMLDDTGYSISSNGVMYRQDRVGCIPDILDHWFSQRVEFRKLEKKFGHSGNKEQYEFYKKRQLVQKILLNSLYGVLGLPAFRFYNIDNAEAVTLTGQAVIKNTANIVNIKYNKELGTNGKDYNIYIDTDSVFFSAAPMLDHRHSGWKTKTDDEIAVLVNDIAAESQDYINAFYDILAKKFFNLDEHRFEIKKEFVSKSGIWLAKKRYAQWIISDNGVPVDKLDVKGLDVVRSSYPKAFRKFMSEVLIDILKSSTEDELSLKINNYKQLLSELDVVDIAKNSSVKGLSKYLIKKKSKMFEFKKGTPAHVKAALAFNELLVHFDCPYRYAPLRDGDKIKWAYLKNNPFGLDAVAFRGDGQDPDEIMELLKSHIDYDKIFERELLSKLQDFYGALGWGEVISSQKTAARFFQF